MCGSHPQAPDLPKFFTHIPYQPHVVGRGRAGGGWADREPGYEGPVVNHRNRRHGYVALLFLEDCNDSIDDWPHLFIIQMTCDILYNPCIGRKNPGRPDIALLPDGS